MPTTADSTLPIATAPPAPSSALPNEILLLILPLLAQPDLARWLRVSRDYHDVAARILYKSISIRVGGPSSNKPNISMPQARTVSADLILQATLTRLAGFNVRPNPFNYTTHLTLSSHPPYMCGGALPLLLPHLDTLRIQPGYEQDRGNLRDSDHQISGRSCPTHTSSAPCSCIPSCNCKLITYLRPRRLILGDATTHVLSGGLGLRSGPLPSSIKELVILVGMLTGNPKIKPSPQSLLADLPATVSKVTFVLSTVRHGSDSFWADEPHPDFCRNIMVGNLLDTVWLGRALFGIIDGLAKGVEIAIVGAGELAQEYSIEEGFSYGTEELKGEEEPYLVFLKRELVKAQRAKGRDEGEATELAAGIRYISEAEYGGQEEWFEAALKEWDYDALNAKFMGVWWGKRRL